MYITSVYTTTYVHNCACTYKLVCTLFIPVRTPCVAVSCHQLVFLPAGVARGNRRASHGWAVPQRASSWLLLLAAICFLYILSASRSPDHLSMMARTEKIIPIELFPMVTTITHRIRMYAIYIYGNIYHQYTPNVSTYAIHGSYG